MRLIGGPVGIFAQTVVPLRLQVRGQFHALRLAAAQRGCRLAEPQISQADFFQHPQFVHQLRNAGKESERFFHRHIQHVMDVLSVITHGKNLRLVARAFAILADQFHVGQELHFHGHRAVAGAGIAAPAGDVE